MSMWRRVGFSAILMGAIGLASLPGCGGSGGTTGPSPNPEVKIEQPKDAQGNPNRIEDEVKHPAPQ